MQGGLRQLSAVIGVPFHLGREPERALLTKGQGRYRGALMWRTSALRHRSELQFPRLSPSRIRHFQRRTHRGCHITCMSWPESTYSLTAQDREKHEMGWASHPSLPDLIPRPTYSPYPNSKVPRLTVLLGLHCRAILPELLA